MAGQQTKNTPLNKPQSEDKAPLLEPDRSSYSEESARLPYRNRKTHCWLLLNLSVSLLFFIVGAICLVYSTTQLARAKTLGQSSTKLWQPLESGIAYQTVPGYQNGESIYRGPPSDQQFKAWHELLKPLYIRVKPEELALTTNDAKTTLKLEGEDDYVGNIGVFHELHCVRRLRLWLQRDTYYPHMTQEQMKRELHHLDHCLDLIRSGMQCRPDLSLNTFRWKDNTTTGKPDVKPSSHTQCVQWDRLYNWALERTIEHPVYDRSDDEL